METFLNKCIVSDFEKSCYEGYAILFIGFIIIIFNIIAFIKMTKYYGKMNFENTVLLLSFVQSTTLFIQMISSCFFFICVFFFIQILTMCLINNKFRKISRGYVTIKYNVVTKLIIVINALYFVAYVALFILDKLDLFYLNILYYALEIITSFFLAYHCCVFLGLIKQDKHDKQEEGEKEEKNNKENFLGINLIGDGLFYLIKKRQLSCLYLINIICSFLEFILDTTIYATKNSSYFYYIYYSFYFICFFHNFNIFISFYWIIREQYNPNKERFSKLNEEKNERIIDEKFIEDEANNIEGENRRITIYLNDDKKVNRKLSSISNISNESDKMKRKISDNDNDIEVKRKASRTSTFDENDETNVIRIEDIPTKKSE
jgi:hypothetical protein